jgi:hypothetical protein
VGPTPYPTLFPSVDPTSSPTVTCAAITVEDQLGYNRFDWGGDFIRDEGQVTR